MIKKYSIIFLVSTILVYNIRPAQQEAAESTESRSQELALENAKAAISRGDAKELKTFLLSLTPAQKNELVFYAAYNAPDTKEAYDIFHVLRSKGADLNSKNSEGNTPLIEAALQGRDLVASALIRISSYSILVRGKDGISPEIAADLNTKGNPMLKTRLEIASSIDDIKPPRHNPEVYEEYNRLNREYRERHEAPSKRVIHLDVDKKGQLVYKPYG